MAKRGMRRNLNSNLERGEKIAPAASAILQVPEIPPAAIGVSKPPTISNNLMCWRNLDHHEEERHVFCLVPAPSGEKRSSHALYEIPMKVMEDHSSNGFGSVELSRSFEVSPSTCFYGARAVALGSVIYFIGGDCPVICPSSCQVPRPHCHSDVYCLDTLRPQDGWKTCPRMLSRRRCPHVVAVDGKIYVFGGSYTRRYMRRFSSEVFDPKKNEWQYLAELDFDEKEQPISPIHVAMADGDGSNKRILIHFEFTKPLFAYFVASNSWCCLDPQFGADPRSRDICETSVVVDDIVYFFSYYTSEFCGYDLINKTWFPVDDLLAPSIFCEGQAFMFSLGGNTFCFLHSTDYYDDPPYTRGIRYIKFKIEREKGKLCFGKFPLSRQRVTASGPRVTKELFRRFTVTRAVLVECCVVL